jgi:formylglycine-generating enzyme required for sulfatase activity
MDTDEHRCDLGFERGGFGVVAGGNGMQTTAVKLGVGKRKEWRAIWFAMLALAMVTDAAEVRRVEGIGIELIRVPAGTFVMGSPAEEAKRHKAEGPQTKVALTQDFWLGKTPVTQGQYEGVMGENPSHFKAVGKDAPVERVSWLDAMEFCRVLTERERTAGRLPEGFVYTLPTEAQWEYACRAGTTGAYPGNPDKMAWHEGNSGGTTHPVAAKEPNAWGFHDMAGNVLEWCADWYGDYPGGAVNDPHGPKFGHFRIARGGSWRVDVSVGRSAARAGGSAGRRDYTMGFRVALSAEGSAEK